MTTARDIDILAVLRARELAKVFLGCVQIRCPCRFRRVVAPEMHITTILGHVGSIFSGTVSNALWQPILSASSAAVSLVLPVGAWAKIANAIIRSIAIDVVNVARLLSGRHFVNNPVSKAGLPAQPNDHVSVCALLPERASALAGKARVMCPDHPARPIPPPPNQNTRFGITFEKLSQFNDGREANHHNTLMLLTYNTLQQPVLERHA